MAVYSLTWDWSSPKQSLPNSKSSSAGQRNPAARISRVLVTSWTLLAYSVRR
jgi:hypothetical protein